MSKFITFVNTKNIVEYETVLIRLSKDLTEEQMLTLEDIVVDFVESDREPEGTFAEMCLENVRSFDSLARIEPATAFVI